MKDTTIGPTYETCTSGQANHRDRMKLPDHIRPPEKRTPEELKLDFERRQELARCAELIAENGRILAELMLGAGA